MRRCAWMRLACICGAFLYFWRCPQTVTAALVAPATRLGSFPLSSASSTRHKRGASVSPLLCRGQGSHEHGLGPVSSSSYSDSAQDWWRWFIGFSVFVIGFWTGLDCILDPGIEYPWGLLRIIAPTSLLVIPGAAVQACAQLSGRPCTLDEVSDGKKVCAVFLGDSLTHGSLSANYLEVLHRRHGEHGAFVNVGMNMRPSGELLNGRLIEDAVAAKPERGVVVLIGTNNIIRYTLLPQPLRQPLPDWLDAYAADLREIVRRVRESGCSVTIASAPILGEDPQSEEGVLGRTLAQRACDVANEEPGCAYAPLYEATVAHLQQAAASGARAPRSRAYSALESFALLCALPFRIYASQTPLSEIQREQGLELQLDLVHFGPLFAEIAAGTVGEALFLD